MQPSPLRALLRSLAIGLGLIFTFVAGWTASVAVGRTPIDTYLLGLVNAPLQAETPDDLRSQFRVFWEVWNLVESEFYSEDPIVQQELVYGAINGMLGALDDRYTFFQEPIAAEQSRESLEGKFEGIGVYLRVTEGLAYVDRTIAGAPSVAAGLQAGDEIVAVDGEVLAPLIAELNDGEATALVASKIRGPKGEPVTLTMRRGAETEPFDVTIIRDEIPVITVYGQMLEGGVAYIQVTDFTATTTENLDRVLRELAPQQPTAIVLDLRNNLGGYLTTAQEVIGRFHDGGALIEQQRGGVVKELGAIVPSDQQLRLYDQPMVVLINASSASAAEIVAGALRDQRPETVLLGEQSYGKGSVQNIHQLSDTSSVRITIARWLTPEGNAINEVGLTPQYLVPFADGPAYAVPCVAVQRPPEEGGECEDAQLFWGLAFLLEGREPPPPPPVE